VSSSSRISGMDQRSLRPGGKRESRMRGSLDGLGSGVADHNGLIGSGAGSLAGNRLGWRGLVGSRIDDG